MELPAGLPEPDDIYAELGGYTEVLLGRMDAPLFSPYLDLMEVATAYYARAMELTMLIHYQEREHKSREYTAIRTGVLRDFSEMAKRLADLGSRRLSQEQLLSQQRRDIGEAL